MDKRTGLMIILLIGIFLAWSFIMQIVAPPKPQEEQTDKEKPPAKEEPVKTKPDIEAEPLEQELVEDNNIRLRHKFDNYDVVFSNKGGVIRSVKLKDTNGNESEAMEMIFAGPADKAKEYPFSLHFGDYTADDVDTLFDYSIDEAEAKIEFFRTFVYEETPFTVRKTYTLNTVEYMFELTIAIENTTADYINLDFDGVMYTLGIGPQIGPKFEKLEARGEYRKFVYLDRGKTEKDLQSGQVEVVDKSAIKWTGIVGKYYTLIVIPHFSTERVIFDSRELSSPVSRRSALYIERPAKKTSRIEDSYHVYVGPKKRSLLEKYNNKNDNTYGLKDMHLEEVVPSIFLIGAIADLLKYPLDLFFSIVGNYGIAIILLTILIKVIVFPLTRKSYESMSRLQELNPKMTELREKYKDNPKKLNMEMAELYRREGVNPLGGCLPQLLQLPIMFALYILLQEHFGLRHAVFIPGWIDDLSIPEFVVEFDFTIPILNWQHLRLLPFIMLGTQIVSSKLTQTSTGTDSKMKMLPYILVGVFFFILYNLPSGLVLYWTVQNILTTAQMYVYKKYFKNKPPKQKKRRFADLKSYMRR
jgi:YidC/Oxa1 family membrane protein insertase